MTSQSGTSDWAILADRWRNAGPMFRIGSCVIVLGWLRIFFSIFATILVDRHSSDARFWGWLVVAIAVGALMVILGAAMLGAATRRYQTAVPEKAPHPTSRERERAIGTLFLAGASVRCPWRR